MLKKGSGAVLYSAFLLSIQAFAQEDYIRFKSDGTVQALGSFVTDTTNKGVHQTATNSGGVLASYRYYFDRHNGVEANYGYARNTQNYDQFGVNTNSHEATAAYVLRFPRRRWSPFALAGAGELIFDPRAFSGASTQARAAFVYGAGADVNLSEHLFLRAEYRGFVYNPPTYWRWVGLIALHIAPCLRSDSVGGSDEAFAAATDPGAVALHPPDPVARSRAAWIQVEICS